VINLKEFKVYKQLKMTSLRKSIFNQRLLGK